LAECPDDAYALRLKPVQAGRRAPERYPARPAFRGVAWEPKACEGMAAGGTNAAAVSSEEYEEVDTCVQVSIHLEGGSIGD